MSDTLVERLKKYNPFERVAVSKLKDLGLDELIGDSFAVTSLIDDEEHYLAGSIMSKVGAENFGKIRIVDLMFTEIAGIEISPSLAMNRIGFLVDEEIIEQEEGNCSISAVETVAKDLYYAACGEPIEYPKKKIAYLPASGNAKIGTRGDSTKTDGDKSATAIRNRPTNLDKPPVRLKPKSGDRSISSLVGSHEKERSRDEEAGALELKAAEKEGYLPLGYVLDEIRRSGIPYDVRVSPADARETFDELPRYYSDGKSFALGDEGKYVSKQDLKTGVNRMLTDKYNVSGLDVANDNDVDEDEEPPAEELDKIEGQDDDGDSTQEEIEPEEVEDHSPAENIDGTSARRLIETHRRINLPTTHGYRPLQRTKRTKRNYTIISYDEAEDYITKRLTSASCPRNDMKIYLRELLGYRVIDLERSVLPAKDRKGRIFYKPNSYVKEHIARRLADIQHELWLSRVDSGASGADSLRNLFEE